MTTWQPSRLRLDPKRCMARQKAVGYGHRSRVETAVGRYKHIIGLKTRARSSDRLKSETAITVQILNGMTHIAKPMSTRRA